MSSSLSSRKRHRRRRRSHVARPTPADLLRQDRQRRISRDVVLACGAIGIVCAALIMLIWINTQRAIHDMADETRARTEAVATGQANILTEEARRELGSIEQSLSILQTAWNTDPDKFDLRKWQAQMPSLTEVSDDLFIANDKHIIIQDILPQAVGQAVGAAYARFGRGTLETIGAEENKGRDTRVLFGEAAGNGVLRQYLMYLVRPLEAPIGWIIGASYRSSALAKVFADGSLGPHGLSAMIDTRRGGVQAIAGPAAFRPNLNIDDSPMFKALQERGESGIWIGPTAMDGVVRIHAFHRLPGRDLMILVGLDRDDWMAPADCWAAGARSLATVASLLVLAIGGLVLWELWTVRATGRRRRAMERAIDQLTAARTDLAAARLQAQTSAAQMRTVLDGGSDGVALFDADWQLAEWNPRFANTSGLAPEAIRAGLPLDELLRQQARGGLFGSVEDVETEIAHRMAQLRSETGSATLTQTGPDGDSLILRTQTLPNAGLIALLPAWRRGPNCRPPRGRSLRSQRSWRGRSSGSASARRGQSPARTGAGPLRGGTGGCRLGTPGCRPGRTLTRRSTPERPGRAARLFLVRWRVPAGQDGTPKAPVRYVSGRTISTVPSTPSTRSRSPGKGGGTSDGTRAAQSLSPRRTRPSRP